MLKITDFAAKIAEIESYPDKTPFIRCETKTCSASNRKGEVITWNEKETHVIYRDNGAFTIVEESLIGKGSITVAR